MHILVHSPSGKQPLISVGHVTKSHAKVAAYVIEQDDQFIMLENKAHALELVEAVRAIVGDWDE